MRLDRILQALLPHHDHFFDMFEEAARCNMRAADVLLLLPVTAHQQWPGIVSRIKEIEHEGDDVSHRIFTEVSGTFVTPFDPEDIHVLATVLDNILDNIDGSARRLLLYRINACPPDMVALMESLRSSVEEVQNGVKLLRKLAKPEEMRRIIQRIRELEDEADEIFARAVANLFERETDPVEILKQKEIYVALETATDVCDDAADVLEALLIKHA
jgi:predicted phosphate transport protein (TIGR00153 family)